MDLADKIIIPLLAIIVSILLYKWKSAEARRVREVSDLRAKEALELNERREKTQKLSNILSRITKLLEDIVKLFEKETVPTREGNELILLIQSLDEYVEPFEKENPKLSAVCKKLSNEIIDVLIKTDLLMRGEPGKPKLNDSINSENPDFRCLSGFVKEANLKLLRMAAATSALSQTL